MLSILLIGIDNRLVYGQVGVTRTKMLGANLIIVVDDIVTEDGIQQSLTSATAELSGVGTRLFTVGEAATIISRTAPEQKTLTVCRTPKDVRRPMEVGVALKEANVGNMHFSERKRAMTRRVCIDDKGMDDLKYLVSKDTNVYVRDVSGDPKSVIE